jgi:L-asparaginase / beta-aspartyl-peptidase
MTVAIIVHGGAGTISNERVNDAQQGCKDAAVLGWQALQRGESALNAVEAAVRALENNPTFNAGTGACLSDDGSIQLDAGIMDGSALRTGAVAGVERIKNPITLARLVLESPHAFLISEGAQQFALEQGLTLCTHEDLLTERQYNAWKNRNAPELTLTAPEETKHGTVGAVALDEKGVLAAATSTGGILHKHAGRVGDSPLIGCGFYADEHAAISCTGYGEDFIRLTIAHRAAFYVAQGLNAHDAATSAIDFLQTHAQGTGGLILVDRTGAVSFARNSQHMAYAAFTSENPQGTVGI